jgi:hypothetical protein
MNSPIAAVRKNRLVDIDFGWWTRGKIGAFGGVSCGEDKISFVSIPATPECVKLRIAATMPSGSCNARRWTACLKSPEDKPKRKLNSSRQ